MNDSLIVKEKRELSEAIGVVAGGVCSVHFCNPYNDDIGFYLCNFD